MVEFGSRNINGSARDLVDCVNYIGVDIHEGPGVNVVIDAADYTPQFKAPDLIICMETLEHAPNACAVVQNAARILRDGGHLIVTCATDPRPPHTATGINADGTFSPAEGEYYQNIKPEDLQRWAVESGLNILAAETKGWGDTYLLAVKAS